MIAIVDVQFLFAENHEEIVKQVTIHDIKNNNTECFTFKPPKNKFPDNDSIRQNKWLEINHHGLNWFHGDLEYEESKSFLKEKLEKFQVIFTKGLSKVKYLETIIYWPIVDITDIGCPSLNSLRLYNSRSKSDEYFSIKNVKSLRSWLLR